jgi:hypothetical protein
MFYLFVLPQRDVLSLLKCARGCSYGCCFILVSDVFFLVHMVKLHIRIIEYSFTAKGCTYLCQDVVIVHFLHHG